MLERVGYHGATRQSWQRDSIRTAIAELRAGNRGADEGELAKLFAERMRVDDDLLNAAAEYAVINTVNSIERAVSRVAPSTQESEAQRQQITALTENVKEQIMMLNLEMPNGKRMRWCTGAEMVKFGGAFQKIGKKVGATKTVGSVLEEKQIRQIMSAR